MNTLNIQMDIDKLSAEVRPQILEMAKIKTRFDTEKFTVGKEGPFTASQFHFLMRQYRFAIAESRRLLIDIDECQKKIGYLNGTEIHDEEGVAWLSGVTFKKIELRRQQLKKDELEIDLKAKLMMLEDFEEMREAIIKRNNNKSISAEQYDKEQPEYYSWFLATKAINQINARLTGINEGIIESIQQGARKPVLENSEMFIDPIDTDSGGINLSALNNKRFTEEDPLLKDPRQQPEKQIITPGPHILGPQ